MLMPKQYPNWFLVVITAFISCLVSVAFIEVMILTGYLRNM